MSAPLIQLVVAYSTNRIIGKDNTLPWRLPSDLAHFKRVTLGQPIIMGRKTWESLGRPLPGRPNLVITRNKDLVAEGAQIFHSLDEALDACQDIDRVCIIGGEELFRSALPLAHQVIATEVHANFDGDTWFPPLDPTQWTETQRESQPTENDLSFDYVTYSRSRT